MKNPKKQIAKKRKISQIEAYIKSIELLLSKAKKKKTSSKVVMLERSHLAISYDKLSKKYGIDYNLKPQLFAPMRSERIAKTFKTGDEKAKTVTEAMYYQIKLGDAKALLITYSKKMKPQSLSDLKSKLKAIEEQYKALASDERKSKVGLRLQMEIMVVRRLLRDCESGTKTK